ncbi:hypothetical protein [Curtobacterium sp. MCBA15_009]|uniref:hypothetical protein n=1 Tax=Curtobacterium sp. MCBA15_009 TaxID=1898737 RepID=UPI001113DCB0|nr:hypothetical protein [Curtobacterium sp. MCBA15_009]
MSTVERARVGRGTAVLLGAVVAVATVLATAGCTNHLNAGSGAGEDFADHFRTVDGVAAVTGSGTNNLPFSGEASVAAVLDDDLSDARLTDLVDEMGRYAADHTNGSLRWSGRIVVDGYQIPLAAKRTPNHRTLDLLAEVRHDDRFDGGEIDPEWRIALRAAATDDLVTAWHRARELSTSDDASVLAYSGVPDDSDRPEHDASWVLSSTDQDARDLYDDLNSGGAPRKRSVPEGDGATARLAAQVMAVPDVDGAVITPSSVSAHATSFARTDSVRRAVEARAPDGTLVLVSGGPVHRTGAGDHAAADRVVDAVLASQPDLTRVEEAPDRVGVVVPDIDTATTLAGVVGAVHPPAAVDRVDLATDESALGDVVETDTQLVISAPPDALVRAARIAAALDADGPVVVRLPSSAEGQADVRVTVPSSASFPGLAKTLRALDLQGASLQIRLPSGADNGSGTVNADLDDPTDVSAGSDAADQRTAQAWRDAWAASR